MRTLTKLLFAILLTSCASQKDIRKEYLYVGESHKFYFPDEDGIAPRVSVKAGKLVRVDRNNFIIVPYNEGSDVEITVETSRRVTKSYPVQYIPMPELMVRIGESKASSRDNRTISANDLKSSNTFWLVPLLYSFHHDCTFNLQSFDIMLVSNGKDAKKLTNVTKTNHCKHLIDDANSGDMLIISNVWALHIESSNLIKCTDLVLHITE